MKTIAIEPGLSYFKKGDDLGHFLKNSLSPIEALRKHAEMLLSDATLLLEIANTLSESEIDIEADTHFIRIKCPKVLGNTLIKRKLCTRDKYQEVVED